MTLTLKDNVQKHVVTAGNYGFAAAGQPLFNCIGSGANAQLIYNVRPGQLVAYTISNGVATTVDESTLAASDIYELYVGVGVDTNGDGNADDVRHIGVEQISGCEPREVSTSSPRCGNPQVVDFYFDCTQCDETYSVMVSISDNMTQSYSPWNKSFSEFVGSIVTNCSSCDDCPVEHNCKEVACKLSDALNSELQLRVGQRIYPDWRGKGLPRPYHATRLHANSFIYCLAPQTEAGSCEDCTYYDAISGVNINGNYHEFVANVNPLDNTQTLPGQMEGIVKQINELFITEYNSGQTNVNPHAGSAYLTGTYQQCCSVQLHVNTCDANFQLLDVNGDPIAPTTSVNPFTQYGTAVGDANCIDCGDNAVKASGTLTLTGNAVDAETITIGSKTYTFEDTLTDVDGNVHIGATVEETLDNLKNAINLGPGAGTDYAASMTKHPTVEASEGAGDTLVITAITAGTAGNSIATTETMTNGSFGAATLENGAAGTIGTTTYPCGIRIIAEQVKASCSFEMEKPLSHYGRKIEVRPFGDGWDKKPWRVVEVQAMELPAGFGSWIKWLELQDIPEGRGRYQSSRSSVTKGWGNYHGNKARIKNMPTARCDKNYCSYYMKSFIEKKKVSNEYGVITVHSNVHIPSTDSTTVTAWEAFLTALIGFNPSCKTLSVVNCDTSLGSC